MKTKLISYTQARPGPTDFQVGSKPGEISMLDLVAYCARVSNPDNQNNSATNEKLVKYLIKHKHWSPLEMVSVCMEVETTRDIGRQLLRHRSFSFQEFSQRYADPTKDLEFEIREARLQDPKNRQNSVATDDAELLLVGMKSNKKLLIKPKRFMIGQLKMALLKNKQEQYYPKEIQ